MRSLPSKQGTVTKADTLIACCDGLKAALTACARLLEVLFREAIYLISTKDTA